MGMNVRLQILLLHSAAGAHARARPQRRRVDACMHGRAGAQVPLCALRARAFHCPRSSGAFPPTSLPHSAPGRLLAGARMPGTLAAALEAQAEMHDAAFAVTAPANTIAEEVVKPELGEMDIGEDFVAVRDSDISGSSDDAAGSDDGAVLVTSPKKRPATNAPCTPEKATRARTGRFTQRLLLPSTPPRQLFGSDPYVGAHISDAPSRIRTAAAAPRELGPLKVRIIHAQTDKATLQMNFSQDDTIRKVKSDIASAVDVPAAALMLKHDYLHDEAVMTLGDYRVFQWLARFPDWVLDCDLMVDTPPELALTEDAEVTTADTDPGIARVVAQI